MFLEWIENKKNDYLKQIEDGQMEFKEKSLPNFLAIIFKQKDKETGWTKIKGELIDFAGLKYLEETNLIVKRRSEVKLKTALLEKLVKELSTK